MNTAIAFQPGFTPRNTSWDLTELLISFPEKTYEKGDLIFKSGKTEDKIFFVVKGKVLLFQHNYIFDKEMVNGLFLNSDFINLDILAGDIGNNRYAVAKSKTVIKAIPHMAFLNLMSQYPFFSRFILKKMARQQRGTQNHLQQIELMSTRQRILHFLVEYVEKAGKDVGFEKVVRSILTHQELGSLCSASRQSMTTVLNELRQLNIIHFNRRYLLVRDMEKLREMALTTHLQKT